MQKDENLDCAKNQSDFRIRYNALLRKNKGKSLYYYILFNSVIGVRSLRLVANVFHAFKESRCWGTRRLDIMCKYLLRSHLEVANSGPYLYYSQIHFRTFASKSQFTVWQKARTMKRC